MKVRNSLNKIPKHVLQTLKYCQEASTVDKLLSDNSEILKEVFTKIYPSQSEITLKTLE